MPKIWHFRQVKTHFRDKSRSQILKENKHVLHPVRQATLQLRPANLKTRRHRHPNPLRHRFIITGDSHPKSRLP